MIGRPEIHDVAQSGVFLLSLRCGPGILIGRQLMLLWRVLQTTQVCTPVSSKVAVPMKRSPAQNGPTLVYGAGVAEDRSRYEYVGSLRDISMAAASWSLPPVSASASISSYSELYALESYRDAGPVMCTSTLDATVGAGEAMEMPRPTYGDGSSNAGFPGEATDGSALGRSTGLDFASPLGVASVSSFRRLVSASSFACWSFLCFRAAACARLFARYA